ncbi:MAG: DEAD/DEAH box helicase family protein [Rhodopirellula sp.]|nr:DEAD/DEAH box helicase family protein [Rhodopirellula sp.]
MSTATDRQGFSSGPEDIFVDIFAQVFGLEQVQKLTHDYPAEDIYGGGRFIDYALRTAEERVAFEIDGLTWHMPGAVSVEKFEDDLLRQNSLVHQGWRIFRWTDRQLQQDPERVKEELALFLERISGFFSFDDFLPQQLGELVDLELRPHQEEALAVLAAMRADHKTIALLTHAQGTGKTIVAIADAKRLGGRTLFLAHTRPLVQQAFQRFGELWPEASVGLFMGGSRDPDAYNVVGSVQAVSARLSEFLPTEFDYLVIDEAHHAAARVYRSLLGYFRAKFVLGLTATPDRADGQSILDLFRESAHRLSLREAIELGELVPIRCVRVETNVDLSRVRFNQVQYNRRELEEKILIPPRDRLIVDTYLQHVRGRKAVVFCVNVRHGESLAERLREAGVPAQSVSGRMPQGEREEHLAAFHAGRLRVLCACDILNEGWDCPDVEVLLMARPTLSKVVYLQQLGRGTRKAPGKESLLVFDFVDNATRYNQSLSLHRIAGQTQYRPGGFVLAPEDQRRAEEEAMARGEKPNAIVEIGLWVKDYREIDLFDWQDAVAGMLTVAQLEVELAASEGLVRRAVERGQVAPDHTLTLGDRTYCYFSRDRIPEVRAALDLPEVGEHNIRDLFLKYIAARDMSASYKPVLLLAILDAADDRGRAKLADAVANFRQFYNARREQGLPVESLRNRMARVESMEPSDVQGIMLGMPFEKFERRKYLKYDRDLAYVRFHPDLWRQLRPDDLQELRQVCNESIARYYERIG